MSGARSIPKQAYTLVLVFLLYCSPAAFFISPEFQRYVLVFYITHQLLTVVFLNKFVHEAWIIGVILVESIAMIYNTVLFMFWFTIDELLFILHSKFMFLAFLAELLIINMSLRGGVDGNGNSRNSQLPDFPLRCRLNHLFNKSGLSEVAK